MTSTSSTVQQDDLALVSHLREEDMEDGVEDEEMESSPVPSPPRKKPDYIVTYDPNYKGPRTRITYKMVRIKKPTVAVAEGRPLSSPTPMEMDQSSHSTSSQAMDTTSDPDQHSATNALASLQDPAVSLPIDNAPVDRELMAGIFQEASQSLKPFSPPRKVPSSVDAVNTQDDPLNFSQDMQPTASMVFRTPVDVEAASVASSGPIKPALGRTGMSPL